MRAWIPGSLDPWIPGGTIGLRTPGSRGHEALLKTRFSNEAMGCEEALRRGGVSERASEALRATPNGIG